MTEIDNTPMPKKRSVLVPVLLVVAALGLFAGAFVFLGGADLVDSILGGGDSELASQVPPKPTAEPAEDPAPAGDDEAAADADADVDEAADEAADDEADSGTASTTKPATSGSKPVPTTPASTGGGVTPASGVQVPAEAKERMYWEQVDSQEQIGKLAAGKITSFSFTPQSATATEARLRVTTVGDNPISGTAVLRAYDGVWFFSSITRDGNTSLGPAGRRGDISVVNTIVEQQASSQDVIGAFVDGGYTTVTVKSVSMGSGTATIDVEFGGGTKARQAGQIICISKDISGQKHWFLTSFREL